jgi:hypothetical protein
MSAEVASVATAAIAAINDRDFERFRSLLTPEVAVVTGRSVHSGTDAAVAWAAKEYDHLVRRFEIDEFRLGRGRVLAVGSVQYVWSEGGEVADSSPIALEVTVEGERASRLELYDDTAMALATFDP